MPYLLSYNIHQYSTSKLHFFMLFFLFLMKTSAAFILMRLATHRSSFWKNNFYYNILVYFNISVKGQTLIFFSFCRVYVITFDTEFYSPHHNQPALNGENFVTLSKFVLDVDFYGPSSVYVLCLMNDSCIVFNMVYFWPKIRKIVCNTCSMSQLVNSSFVSFSISVSVVSFTILIVSFLRQQSLH